MISVLVFSLVVSLIGFAPPEPEMDQAIFDSDVERSPAVEE